MQSPESFNVLFTRSGTDANLNDFCHELIYSGTTGKEQVFLISTGMDLDGVPFREEWEHSESAEAIVQMIAENDYLSLTRAEFENEVLPNLARISPVLAKEVRVLADDGTEFCGDC
ncbi:MAG: hypothetical protein JNJ70_13125 [Verrucomicrobiales bacterium]|nr:hypothetical protein [Verrucomicrobiales bacterium]